MSIHFAGVPLNVEDPRGTVRAFLETQHPLEDLRVVSDHQALRDDRRDSIRGTKRPVHLPIPNWPEPPPVELNTLYWPTGASRWAQGWFLASGTRLGQILETLGTGFPASGLLTITCDREETDAVVAARMFMLSPRPLFVTASAVGDTLWLLPLVDVRYFWQYKTAGAIEVDESTTWESLITTIGTALGVTISGSAIPAALGRPDEQEWDRPHENAALLLDAAAQTAGLRIVRQFSGAVQAWSYEDSQASFDGQILTVPRWSLCGGNIIEGGAPESLQVVFPAYCYREPHLDAGGWVEVVANAHSAGVVANSFETLYTSAAADFSSGDLENPDNAAELAAYAQAAGDDYFGWLTRRYDATFSGVQPWSLTGFDDYMLFRAGVHLGMGDYSQSTRIASLPDNFAISHLPAQFATVVHPPCCIEWIEFQPASMADPFVQSSNSHLYDAKIARLDDGADFLSGADLWQTCESVWAVPANCADLDLQGTVPMPPLPAGKRVLARPAGKVTHQAEERPLYAFELWEVEYFAKLQEDLSQGTTATANLLHGAQWTNDSGISVEVRTRLLNTTEKVSSGKAIAIRYDPANCIFAATNAACNVDDVTT